MRVCISLRGIHYSDDDITKYNDNKMKTDYRKSIDNYKEYLIDPLKSLGYIVDIMIFTYHSPLLDQLISDYNPIHSNIISDSERYNGTSWNRQIAFNKNTIEGIKEVQSLLNYKYDLIVNTRFDLKFNTKITDMNIDYLKFNSAFKHPNGNCDDNLWVFTSNHIDIFYESMNHLYKNKEVTHKINKYIPNIHYMHNAIGLNQGNIGWDDYVYWSFLRIK